MTKTCALLRSARSSIRCCSVFTLVVIIFFELVSFAWCTIRDDWQADTRGLLIRTRSEDIGQWVILIAGKKNRGENEFHSLPPHEKNTLLRKWNRLNQMPPQERQDIERLFDKWQHLTPAERRQLQRALDNKNNLSPSEKETIRRKFGN